MTDSREDLAALATRVADGVDSGSVDSERAVQLKAVEPLLEILGWDVRGSEVVPESDLGNDTVEYLLQIEDSPLVAVRTALPDTSLEATAVPTLAGLIESGYVSRAIATDARDVILLLATGEEIHRRSFPFRALPDNAEALGRFHRSILETEHQEQRVDHREVAGELAAKRDEVLEAVTEEILSVTGPEMRPLVVEESATAVDAIVDRLRERADADGEEKSLAETANDVGGSSACGEDPPTADSNSADSPDVESAGDASDENSDANGEYVVRFFGGASSVGAVGTGSPRSTTIGVVRYLLENQELSSAVTLPWTVDDGPPILAEEPPSSEWTALEAPGGGSIAVRRIDDPAAATAVIEALADAVGLRVMFQGDW